MKFSTMIPQHDNNGQWFDRHKLDGVYRIFWLRYGGCTVDAVADGFWKGDDGKLYVDKVRRLTVATDNNSKANLDYARLLVRRVGVFLGQKSMFFEHDYYLGRATVEFHDIDPDEDYIGLSDKLADDAADDAANKA